MFALEVDIKYWDLFDIAIKLPKGYQPVVSDKKIYKILLRDGD